MYKYFIFLFTLIDSVYSQPIYFNETYNVTGNIEIGTGIFVTSNENYTVAGQVLIDNVYGIVFLNLNNFGEITNFNSLIVDSITFTTSLGSLFQSNDGNYVIGGFTRWNFSDSDSANPITVKFNQFGDTLWTKQFGHPQKNDDFFKCILCNDGGFACAGTTAGFSSSNDAYLVKTDSDGNLLWQKNYGGSSVDRAFSLIQTSDQGFLIIGGTNSFGDPDGDVYLVKTDSSGNQMWFKTFGGAMSDGGSGAAELLSGGYVIAGHKDYVTSPMAGKGYLVRIDSDGNKLWDREYGTGLSQLDAFETSPLLINNEIIVVGGRSKNAAGSAGNNPIGWLLCVDLNGDTIWSRTYTIRTNDHYFTDIKATPDGGFVMCGYVFPDGSGNTEDIWVVKVDSIGCPFPNCDTIVGAVPLFPPTKQVAVFPNPAKEYFYVAGEMQWPVTVAVLDMQGKVVVTQNLPSQYHRMQLGAMPPGAYLYSIIDGDGNEFKGKFVRE